MLSIELCIARISRWGLILVHWLIKTKLKFIALYCVQIASSTWAMHLLRLNNMSTAECHRAAGARWGHLSSHLIIIMPWHNIHIGDQVPRPPRPGQTQVSQVGDNIPRGQRPLRETRISLPGDRMIHWSSDDMWQVLCSRTSWPSSPGVRTFSPKDLRWPEKSKIDSERLKEQA